MKYFTHPGSSPDSGKRIPCTRDQPDSLTPLTEAALPQRRRRQAGGERCPPPPSRPPRNRGLPSFAPAPPATSPGGGGGCAGWGAACAGGPGPAHPFPSLRFGLPRPSGASAGQGCPEQGSAMSEESRSDDFPSSPSLGRERGRFSLPSTSRNGAVRDRDPRCLLSPRPPSASEEEEEEERETAGEKRGRPETAEEAGDESSRRVIRNRYRELIYSVQQNREDMLSSKSNRLTEALEEANKLFSGVSRAREAALDAQFLVIASNLGKEKANELRSEMTAFDSLAFAEDLLTFMGINRTEDNDSDAESSSGGYLPSNAWHKLGEETEKYFRRAPSFHYMLGSFKSDPPVPRQRIERQKKSAGGEGKRAMPAQLKKMEESHQEATEKEVERILGLLQTHFKNDPDTPISFFDLVIDPNSFARTVENIFHVSFIIRDGFARLKLDGDKLPIIEPSKDNERKVGNHSGGARNQVVLSLSHREWKEIVERYEITEPMISPPYDKKEDEMEIT
ncbi:non-structural maintenance of chromosomes element 4 homolog A [Phaethornis superciliosus]